MRIKPIRKRKEFYLLMSVLFIFLLSLIHSIPAFTNVSLGWDFSFYLYGVSSKTSISAIVSNNTEPLYFILFRPLARIIGDLQTIQFSLFIMFFVFLFGFYLVCKQLKFRWYAIIFLLLFLTFAPGISRMWFDEERNFLAISIFPYFVYFFFSRYRYSIPISILLLSLMVLSHRTVLIPLLGIFVFSLIEKKYFIRTLSILIPFGIIAYLFVTMGIGHNIANTISTSFINSIILPDTQQAIQGLYWFFYYDGIFLATIFFSLFLLKFDVNVKFWTVILIGMVFSSILYDSDFGGRIRLLIALPSAMLFGLLLNSWNEIKRQKMHLMAIILIAFTVLFLIFFGGYFLFSAIPTYSTRETEILAKFDVGQGYLLTTSRLDYAAKYYSNVLPSHQLVGEWYNFTANNTQSDPKMQLFYGLGSWKESARTIAKGENIYIFWSNGDSIINQTLMNQRIQEGEIKLLLPNDNNEYLGELNYR